MSNIQIEAGPGIIIQHSNDLSYETGEPVDRYVISTDFIMPYQIYSSGSENRKILMTNDAGTPGWVDPLEKIHAQNSTHPSIQAAWENVLAALQEYEMMVKLCKESKGS